MFNNLIALFFDSFTIYTNELLKFYITVEQTSRIRRARYDANGTSIPLNISFINSYVVILASFEISTPVAI